jgi:acetyltransferase-like isoleucine patch superfamily enzyme
MKIIGYIYYLFLFFEKVIDKLMFYCLKSYLLLKGSKIGNNVKIGRRVRFILGKNSILILSDNVTISDDCWIIVHDNSSLIIGDNTFISHHCILSSNSEVSIGKYSAIGPYCVILDTDKNFKDPTTLIRHQGFASEPIIISDDVWLGAFCVVTKGVTLGRHSVIAAHSVVTKDVDSYTLNGGVPSKKIYSIKENNYL